VMPTDKVALKRWVLGALGVSERKWSITVTFRLITASFCGRFTALLCVIFFSFNELDDHWIHTVGTSAWMEDGEY